MRNVDIHIGDCIASMRGLPDQSVHTCVTSPPYFGLRDYGMPGQIGLEPSPAEFVAAMVEVFREVKRVLRDDGTLWLNLGDSYSTESKWGGATSGKAAAGIHGAIGGGRQKVRHGIPDKNLLGIPWRVAFALQDDGWYLRQDIIWHKPNPMPESVTDRCTKAHEYLFLLSKSPRYFFDSEAIKEPVKSNKGNGRSFRGGGSYTGGNSFNNSAAKERETRGNKPNETGMRNRRSVWSVSTAPFKGAHFATFPPDLIEPCILAGSPVGGTVLDPFGGSGTTAGVALKHGRKAVICELNPEYAAMMPERISAIAGCTEDMFATASNTRRGAGGGDGMSEVEKIKGSAAHMLTLWDHAMSGQPGADEEAFRLLSRAACFGAGAFEAHPQHDAAPGALLRSFLIALIDPMDQRLDYLRGGNQPK